MSSQARYTILQVFFDDDDVTEDISKDLLSVSYTDNAQDEADDLQITLDDWDGLWAGSWLKTPNQAVSKGTKITAAIIQKNWESDGKDWKLDCGVFVVDSVALLGPPDKVIIKAISIPQASTIQTEQKTKLWENTSLSKIVAEIANENKLKYMYEASSDSVFEWEEQMQESDIVFLQRLSKNAGLSLKVTAEMIVLFDAAEYEQKPAICVIEREKADVSQYRFLTNFHDTGYSSCKVSYTDPYTKETYKGKFIAPNYEGNKQVLRINEKVSSNEEAEKLAEKRLREKNEKEFTANFEFVGDVRFVAGMNLEFKGWGAFDGKYIIETAFHVIGTGGYKTNVSLRRTLEGY